MTPLAKNPQAEVPQTPRAERPHWESHWSALRGDRSLFGRLASLVRRLLLCRAVRHYSERFFPQRGVFVEAGCGTAESSTRMERRGRTMIGLDFSLEALREARSNECFDALVCADIRRLPFRDGSVTGFWNLGVMEHFLPASCRQILREMRRTADDEEGTLLLFWPPTFGLSKWVLAPFEWLIGRRRGEEFRFFPDEVNRLASKDAARRAVGDAGFAPLTVDFTPRDGFNHLVVVARADDE